MIDSFDRRLGSGLQPHLAIVLAELKLDRRCVRTQAMFPLPSRNACTAGIGNIRRVLADQGSHPLLVRRGNIPAKASMSEIVRV
jgi:hypothetical protein